MTLKKKHSLLFLITVIVYVGGTSLYGFCGLGARMPVYVSLAFSELMVVLASLVFIKNEKITPKELGNRPLAGSSFICLIGIALLITPLMSLLNVLSSVFAGNAASQIIGRLVGKPMLLNLIFLAAIPAAAEELVFRGVLFHGYRGYGLWPAALVSGLFFGLMHLNFNQFSYGFAMGVILAVLVEATGSLLSSVIVHFIINFQTVLLIEWYSGYSDQLTAVNTQTVSLTASAASTYTVFALLLLAAAALVATALAMLLIRLLAKLNGRQDYMHWVLKGGEKRILEKRINERLIDGFFAAAVLLCIAIMVLNLLS